MDIVVKEELKAYIDPLTADEHDALERSILAEGCRDALVLWGDVLVDGLFVADVEDLRMDASAVLAERLRCRGNVFGRPAAHVHLGAARQKPAAQAQPNSGGRARDDRDFSLKEPCFLFKLRTHDVLLPLFGADLRRHWLRR